MSDAPASERPSSFLTIWAARAATVSGEPRTGVVAALLINYPNVDQQRQQVSAEAQGQERMPLVRVGGCAKCHDGIAQQGDRRSGRQGPARSLSRHGR